MPEAFGLDIPYKHEMSGGESKKLEAIFAEEEDGKSILTYQKIAMLLAHTRLDMDLKEKYFDSRPHTDEDEAALEELIFPFLLAQVKRKRRQEFRKERFRVTSTKPDELKAYREGLAEIMAAVDEAIAEKREAAGSESKAS